MVEVASVEKGSLRTAEKFEILFAEQNLLLQLIEVVSLMLELLQVLLLMLLLNHFHQTLRRKFRKDRRERKRRVWMEVLGIIGRGVDEGEMVRYVLWFVEGSVENEERMLRC